MKNIISVTIYSFNNNQTVIKEILDNGKVNEYPFTFESKEAQASHWNIITRRAMNWGFTMDCEVHYNNGDFEYHFVKRA